MLLTETPKLEKKLIEKEKEMQDITYNQKKIIILFKTLNKDEFVYSYYNKTTLNYLLCSL